MKTVTVSESALDSIKAMGEADAARIAKLEAALKRIDEIIGWSCEFDEIQEIVDEALK